MVLDPAPSGWRLTNLIVPRENTCKATPAVACRAGDVQGVIPFIAKRFQLPPMPGIAEPARTGVPPPPACQERQMWCWRFALDAATVILYIGRVFQGRSSDDNRPQRTDRRLPHPMEP